MLIQLTYASRTSSVFTQTDLSSILKASQRNNARAGVTGALCLANGIFLQQLEGDRAEVNRLYHRILADPRHREPAVLDFAEITSRRFTTCNSQIRGVPLSPQDDEYRNVEYYLSYVSNGLPISGPGARP